MTRHSEQSSLLHPSPTGTYVAVALAAVANGVVAAWVASGVDATVLNLPAEVWTFLVVWAGATAYFSYNRRPSGVLAAGLYTLAVLVVLMPVSTYGPLVFAATDGTGTDTGLLVDGVSNLLSWGTVAGLVALLAWAASRWLARRADRLSRRRLKRELRNQ